MKNILFISILFLFAGCNPAKKVMNNQKQFEKIGQSWAKQNPCANDTTIVFKAGRVDTFQLPAPVFDVDHAADSISQALAAKYQQSQELCNRQVKDAYNAGYMKASAEWGSIKIPMPRHDTINHYINDTRTQTVLQNESNELQKQLTAALKSADDYKSQRNTARLILVLLAMAVAGLAYLKFIK